MSDRETIIYTIERCICHAPDACHDCPEKDRPYHECMEMLLNDALELLKEQEPIRTIEKWKNGYYFSCGNCQKEFGIIEGEPKYCPECGRKVKWNE